MNSATQDSYAVILFVSTGHALKAEKALQHAGIGCKLIPVPRHLSSDCGVRLRVALDDKEVSLKTLLSEGVEIEGSHNI